MYSYYVTLNCLDGYVIKGEIQLQNKNCPKSWSKNQFIFNQNQEKKNEDNKANDTTNKKKEDILNESSENEKEDEKETQAPKPDEESKINSDDNYIILPEKLKNEINNLPEIDYIEVDKNHARNFCYRTIVAESIKDLKKLDFSSIFSEKNKHNVKYYYYNQTPGKKLLLLDLDGTLINSIFRSTEDKNELKELSQELYGIRMTYSKCKVKRIIIKDDTKYYLFDVYLRPHLMEFLKEVSKYFDLGIFTSSTKDYADPILDFIEKDKKFFKFRLYRDACIQIQEKIFIKDLRIIKNIDLAKVVLLDNNLYSFINQPSNGFPIYSFFYDYKERYLNSAKDELINTINRFKDVREICEEVFKLSSLFGEEN